MEKKEHELVIDLNDKRFIRLKEKSAYLLSRGYKMVYFCLFKKPLFTEDGYSIVDLCIDFSIPDKYQKYYMEVNFAITDADEIAKLLKGLVELKKDYEETLKL